MDRATVAYAVGLALCVVLAGLAALFIWHKKGTEGEAEAAFWGLSFKKLTGAGLMLVLGVVGAAVCIVKLATLPGLDGVEVAHVTEIDGAPAAPDLASGSEEEKLQRVGVWLRAWRDNAQIVIDRGIIDDVRRGDYFAAIADEEKVKGLGNLASLQDETTTLLRVGQVFADSSTSQVASFNYAKFSEKFGDENLSMVFEGQAVVRLPREEIDWRDRIDDAIVSKDYRLAIEEANRFLQLHSEGWFASDVEFDKAYAQYHLKRYQAAARTFALFLDRYPFHPSAGGARGWLEKAERKLREDAT